MRCPRCKHRIRGASWYCPSCGNPVESLNVADLLAPRRHWTLSLLGLAAAAAVLGLGIVLAGRGGLWVSSGPDPIGADLPDRLAGVAAPGAAGDLGSDGDGVVGSGVEDAATPAAPTPPGAGSAGGAPAAAPSPLPTAMPDDGAAADPDVAPPTATPRVRPGQPTWSAAYMPRAPRVDGQLDDHLGTPVEFASVVFGREHWDGGGDLSARMLVGWNAQALFVAARVYDDVFSQPSTGDRLHLGDSLELQLDTDLNGDWDRASYDIDDWQIGLSPGDFAERRPEWWIWRPSGAGGGVEPAADIEVAAVRLADGYSLEAAVPWALLETRPVGGMALGMSLNVSDNDSPEPAQLTMIASSPARSWSDPRTFGTLILEGGPRR